MATSSPARPDAGHWGGIARSWAQVGPPLRPAPADLRVVQDAADQLDDGRQVVVLGVTPELHGLRWPDRTRVVAVDHTVEMITEVWPGAPHAAVLGRWTELPLGSGCGALVVCDGGLHLVDHPAGQRGLAREVARVTEAGGRCILRLFVPAEDREPVEAVITDLEEHRIRDLNILKFRLWMALDDGDGVPLAAVWRVVHDAAPDLDVLADRIGWDQAHLRTIESYRGSTERYSFMTREEVEAMFCAEGFTVEAVQVPTYELGSFCPTVVLRRNGSGRSS